MEKISHFYFFHMRAPLLADFATLLKTMASIFRGYTETRSPYYDAMNRLAISGSEAIHAVHGKKYEVQKYYIDVRLRNRYIP